MRCRALEVVGDKKRSRELGRGNGKVSSAYLYGWLIKVVKTPKSRKRNSLVVE